MAKEIHYQKLDSYLKDFIDYFILNDWLGKREPPEITKNIIVVADTFISYDEYEKLWLQFCERTGRDPGKEPGGNILFQKIYWNKILKIRDKAFKKELTTLHRVIPDATNFFSKEFQDKAEKDSFIERLSFLLADYKSLLLIRKELHNYAGKKAKTIDNIFLTPLLLKEFGGTPIGNDILQKKLCTLLNKLRLELTHPKAVFKIIPYILSITDIFRPTALHDKCEFKDQQGFDSRLFCSKINCLTHRVRHCAKNMQRTIPCNSKECIECGKDDSPLRQTLCRPGKRRFQYNLKPVKFHKLPTFSYPLIRKISESCSKICCVVVKG